MIDEAKYKGSTPGPWSAGADEDGNIVYGADDSVVCAVENPSSSGCDTEEANAKLIADAPSILAELITEREKSRELIDALKELNRCAGLVTCNGIPGDLPIFRAMEDAEKLLARGN